MDELAIRVEDVSKVYRLYNRPSERLFDALGLAGKGRFKEHRALDHVTFDVKKGETVGIIGTNGSGKSTILKIITGVLSPTSGEVEIDDWAILGGHCAVHQFSRIGAHVMVSGGSLISKDIPPFVTAAHNPLSFVGINSIGLRRRDFTNEQIEQIQEMCRILFQSGYSYTKGCELVEREMPQGPERDMMLSFIRNSKRGIIKPYNPRKKNEDIG